MGFLHFSKPRLQFMALLLALSSGKAMAEDVFVPDSAEICGGILQDGGEGILLSGILPVGEGKGCVALSGISSSGGRLKLLSSRKDRYGRRAGRVVDLARKSLAVMMVEEGFAVFFPESGMFGREVAALLAAEDMARRESRGAWGSGAFPVLPATEDVPAGSYAVVEGVVRRAGKGRDLAFLDFGEDYRKDFTAVVPKRLWKYFGDFAAFSGRRVRVRGYVVSRFGPQMEVSRKEALEVLDVPQGDSP